ncbi:uncharacterized protein OCT59_012391 [Rhizophagus irregularis]|uniref:uncharacterized protein n=1 Tax=Rhizophagus irregularis TaxID=588596 RepID=UPI003332000B|nr:hypothetical protein OCT59_012391 [Rhizophagus irregularis]
MHGFGTPRFPKRFGTQYFQTLTWNASWTIQGEIDARWNGSRERLPGRNGYEVHGPVSFWAEFEGFQLSGRLLDGISKVQNTARLHFKGSGFPFC